MTETLWIALSVLYLAGAPAGTKILGGATEETCKAARDAELAKAEREGLVLKIEPCWDASPPAEDEKPKLKLKKERDS